MRGLNMFDKPISFDFTYTSISDTYGNKINITNPSIGGGLRLGANFTTRTSSPFACFGVAISEGSTTILNLIPVRLLRNIEPYTTHNRKGGKANEIGFFDTISGKFYGNDGSGEFTEYVP